jgi:hypothetical protein
MGLLQQQPIIIIPPTTTTFIIMTITTLYILQQRRRRSGQQQSTNNNNRIQKFCQEIDKINSTDPRLDEYDGKTPTELLYSQRMSNMLLQFKPNASDLLQMACHGQHVGRWKIPRSTFPEGKIGYLQWRKQCQVMHAETCLHIMRNECVGMFSIQEEEELKHMLCKEDIKGDALVQTTEDVAALVFLKWYFTSFCIKHVNEPDKIVDILKKTWIKMSDDGKIMAKNKIVGLLGEEQQKLIGKALLSSSS